MNPNHDNAGRFSSGGGSGLSKSDTAQLAPTFSKIPAAQVSQALTAMRSWVDGEDKEYKKVNDALREKSTNATPAVQKIISGLDTIFQHASHSLKKEALVFRGLNNNPNFEVGKTYQDNGFQSTSSNRFTAGAFTPDNGGALLHLAVPAGTRVFAPSGKEGNLESEVLLNRGTRFRVLHVSDKTIHAEVVT